ncbi:hypothetical protein DICVIV_07111 [Dictyocaulus viviparus]|uniref:Uncharacterized protein n=1 Tax=Dictyocaulus viviparus TaxID=29172 RepID=A0A0D8XWW2_DICVI|nr:hypothetical protein DICVIV_07111 [Dictyocaulus viviparus]
MKRFVTFTNVCPMVNSATEDARKVFAADGRQPFIVPLQETTQRYREMKGMNPGLGNL